MKTIFTFVLFLFFNCLFGQEDILLSQNFNNCEFPGDWSIEISGNQEAVWYIGIPDNPESDGSSIDGSCMFIVDDDLTGNNTDSFTLRALSPIFNTSGFTSVELSVDIHFRNASGELLRVLLSDGVNEHELRRYENMNFAGTQFSEFVSLKVDLSLYPAGNYRLIFEYDDKNKWGWWAGFDNVVVKGIGAGVVLFTEMFDQCILPQGWAVVNINGEESWKVGKLENQNAWQSSSLNGTCFAYFDDDGVGEDASPSTVGLITPAFPMSVYRDYFLEFDLIFRQYNIAEWFEVGLIVNNTRVPVKLYTSQVGGDQPDEFVSQILDLSEFKAEEARLYFLYHDGAAWGWWAGIDNIKLTGNGEINDQCTKAFQLNPGDTLDYSIAKAFGDKSIPSACNENFEKALWYKFNTHVAETYEWGITNDYNGVIEVFQGNSCNELALISCMDRDEYGFYGEKIIRQIAPENYFLRISGKPTEFGYESGGGKVFMSQTDSLVQQPANDICEEAISILLDGEFPVSGKNHGAEISLLVPSDNFRSRSDVWYSFTGVNTSKVAVKVVSDFANNITVFTGTCSQLSEIGTNYSGEELILEELHPHAKYYVSIAGNFSTLEGDFELFITPVEEIAGNLDCTSAMEILIDQPCMEFDNHSGGFSGIVPACDPLADSDRWYKFSAPVSGVVDFRFQADFMYTISVYEIKNCSDFTPVYCNREFHFCDGYQTITNLDPGTEYYIQISSSGRVQGFNKGNGCLTLEDGSLIHEWEPLSLSVQPICASRDAILILPSATGGSGEYSYYGHGIVDLIPGNSHFFIEAEDTDGCIATVEGNTPDCSEVDCNIFFELITRDVSCHGKNDGSVELFATGGLGPYILEGEFVTSGSYALNLQPGTYQFTATDAAGCSEDFEVRIEEPEEITWELISFEEEGPEGGSIEIATAGGEGLLEITWYKNDILFAQGVSFIEELEPGEYYARISDGSNCFVTTQVFTVKLTTSVLSFEQQEIWTVYPNPFEQQLNLQFSNSFSGQYMMIVRSVLGVEMYKHTFLPGETGALSINTAGWPTGVYSLIVKNDSERVHKIIVKTK